MANMVQGRSYLQPGNNAYLCDFLDAAGPLSRLLVLAGPAAGSILSSGNIVATGTEVVASTDPVWAYGTIHTGNKDGEKWFVTQAFALTASAGTTVAVLVRAQNQPNTMPILFLVADLT